MANEKWLHMYLDRSPASLAITVQFMLPSAWIFQGKIKGLIHVIGSMSTKKIMLSCKQSQEQVDQTETVEWKEEDGEDKKGEEGEKRQRDEKSDDSALISKSKSKPLW